MPDHLEQEFDPTCRKKPAPHRATNVASGKPSEPLTVSLPLSTFQKGTTCMNHRNSTTCNPITRDQIDAARRLARSACGFDDLERHALQLQLVRAVGSGLDPEARIGMAFAEDCALFEMARRPSRDVDEMTRKIAIFRRRMWNDGDIVGTMLNAAISFEMERLGVDLMHGPR